MRRTVSFLGISVILLTGIGNTLKAGHVQYARAVIDYVADVYTPPPLSIEDPEKYYFPIALARFEKYGVNDSIANEYVSILAERGVFHFASIGLVRILYEYPDAPAVKSRLSKIISHQLSGNLWESEGTENHLNMERTSGLLIAQAALEILPEQREEAEVRYQQMKDWILVWGERFLQYGAGEWNTSIYQAYSIAGWLNLVDYAKDLQISELASRVVDSYVEELAVHYSWGTTGGAEMRGKGVSNVNHEATNYFCRLWFGEKEHDDIEIRGTGALLTMHAILSTYEPSERTIALARKEYITEPYYRKDTRPSYLYEDTAYVTRSFYVDNNFTLGSFQAEYGGYTGACSQLIPWRLVVRNKKGLPFEIGGNGCYYNEWSGKGRSPYTQWAQYKNVLFVLTSVPENAECLEMLVDSVVLDWKHRWQKDYNVRFPGNSKPNIVTRVEENKRNLENASFINLPEENYFLRDNTLIQQLGEVYIVVRFFHTPSKKTYKEYDKRVIFTDYAPRGSLSGYSVEVLPVGYGTIEELFQSVNNRAIELDGYSVIYESLTGDRIQAIYEPSGSFTEPLFDWGYGVLERKTLHTSPPMKQPLWMCGKGFGKKPSLFVNTRTACPYETEYKRIDTGTIRYYLSGIDKDDNVKWKFRCSKGANAGVWDSIPVPSNWELQGFGEYTYGYDTWDYKRQNPENYDIGEYRHSFFLPEEFEGKKIDLVFGGAMTDTDVKLNKESTGPVHQGGFQQFSYPVAHLLKYGQENLLEVLVSEMSANESVNAAERQADYWVFGGIYRPVWLEVKPEESISRVAIDANADGLFTMHVYCQVENEAELRYFLKKNGKPVSTVKTLQILPGKEFYECKEFIQDPAVWSPEKPDLYEIGICLWRNNEILHHCSEKFGFRTFEIRPKEGMFLNGKKYLLKGINRNTFWPESGRTSSKALSISDVNLIKDMNMNAVRMSHSAPDSHFLEACDSLGLLVINELTGWQNAYETEVGKKLVKELVLRDVNHPCVVLWANGNEGGFNEELTPEFARWDIRNRTVIQPWMNFNNLNTRHYIGYDYGVSDSFYGNDVFMPTEFLHGSYDGGHGAGLEDYWARMLGHPLSAGGFLWDFCDSAVKRLDKGGELDAMGDYAADGIVGPYREKEGSFFTVKEIWSPVYIRDRWITPAFDGSFEVENRYTFTNLSDCSFSWKLKHLQGWSINDSIDGKITPPNVEPGQRGEIKIQLPATWMSFDILQLEAIDPYGRMICQRSFPITTNEQFTEQQLKDKKEKHGRLLLQETDSLLHLKAGTAFSMAWNKSSGLLCSLKKGDRDSGLSNGPRLTEGSYQLKDIYIDSTSKDSVKIHFSFEGDSVDFKTTWTAYASGLIRLDYIYNYRKGYEFPLLGITFDYPEDYVDEVILIADGPYRVWKNRLRGVQFGCWNKPYNNTITGETWDYPEFKGYYSHFYGVKIKGPLPFCIYTSTPDLFLHLFTPDKPTKFHKSLLVDAVFPEGSLSFLHGISPVSSRVNGTVDRLGPQSTPNYYQAKRHSEGLKGTLYFDLNDN